MIAIHTSKDAFGERWIRYCKENEISYKVIGAIYKVYNELGPGLLESVYEAALCYQLRKDGLKVDKEIRDRS